MLYILFPSDFFDIKLVEQNYLEEYNVILNFMQYKGIFYNYDTFIEKNIVKFYPPYEKNGLCIYRGWMIKPEFYKHLYNTFLNSGIKFINNPQEYNNCHLFPNSYEKLKDITPKTIWYSDYKNINWEYVFNSFSRFIIKDYVKSVKGFNFPKYFENTFTKEQMNFYVKKFVDLRDNLYTGGIVIKEFVDLKIYGNTTNEYRAFYVMNELLSVNQNSGQDLLAPSVPKELLKKCSYLESNFYTVDFAECSDGSWIVIEVGDGQVSDIPQGQNIFEFYKKIQYFFA